MNEIQRREISSKLRMILEEVNQVFGDARTVILKAYSQALSEGFTPKVSGTSQNPIVVNLLPDRIIFEL